MSRAVRCETELDAPPERVWEVVMDPQRLEDWVTTHHDLPEGAPSQLDRGDHFSQQLRLGGVKFTVEWTVGELEHPRSVTWNGAGPKGSNARVRYELEPLGDGKRTCFGYENEFDLPGGVLGQFAGRLVGERAAKHEAEMSLRKLKELIESEG
jgi:uncharacterized protein YndB with AHSA1/START domain